MTASASASAGRDRELGDYDLLAKLATGGMAEIYLATKRGSSPQSLSVDEVVVVKRILPHLADDEHFVTMFRDEANLASQLVHPNVCRVHGLGQTANVWFIVMEYLHGVALSRLLSRLSKRRQFLDVRVIAGIITQACAGLHHAHEARGADGQQLGVVHRDVSPPNILITANGVVKMLDFGIAKARGASSKTRTGTVKGKNAYMSPEQILGKPLDRRSDIFALGAVMFELLAVKRLFHRESDFLTFKAITEEPIPDIRERRPDLPAAMVAVLTRALAREPGGRFATAAEMMSAIQDAAAPLGGVATPEELAAIIARDFADELANKEEMLVRARQVAAIGADVSELPNVSTSDTIALGPTNVAAVTLPEARRPLPRGALPLSPQARDGELVAPTGGSARRDRAAASMEIERLGPPPPTIPGHGRGARTAEAAAGQPPPGAPPPPMPARPGTAPELQSDISTFAGDPTTDLLGPQRRQFQVGAAIAAVVCVPLAAYWLLAGGSPPTATAPAVEPDAAVAALIPDAGAAIDAGPSREDIVALSRYGFLSIGAVDKAVIYLDNVRLGEAPLVRMPLNPGPYKVKAVGPRGKVRKFEIIIEATKDVDLGTIDWSTN